MIKRHSNKELSTTKKDDENCRICDNVDVKTDVNVIDYWHVTTKYKSSAHKDYNIKVKLYHKISVVFYKLKNYNSYLTIQELDIFDFRINIPNKLEKYISSNINN